MKSSTFRLAYILNLRPILSSKVRILSAYHPLQVLDVFYNFLRKIMTVTVSINETLYQYFALSLPWNGCT